MSNLCLGKFYLTMRINIIQTSNAKNKLVWGESSSTGNIRRCVWGYTHMKQGHKIHLTLSNLVSIFAVHFFSLQNFCSMVRLKGCLIIYVSISRSKESAQRHFSSPYEWLQKVSFFSFAFKPESRKELSRKLQS